MDNIFCIECGFELPSIAKDETGHNMYSRSFKHYINFWKQGN